MSGGGGLKRPRPKLGCRAIEGNKNKQEEKKEIPPFFHNETGITPLGALCCEYDLLT